jgi:hypothetical protein
MAGDATMVSDGNSSGYGDRTWDGDGYEDGDEVSVLRAPTLTTEGAGGTPAGWVFYERSNAAIAAVSGADTSGRKRADETNLHEQLPWRSVLVDEDLALSKLQLALAAAGVAADLVGSALVCAGGTVCVHKVKPKTQNPKPKT